MPTATDLRCTITFHFVQGYSKISFKATLKKQDYNIKIKVVYEKTEIELLMTNYDYFLCDMLQRNQIIVIEKFSGKIRF